VRGGEYDFRDARVLRALRQFGRENVFEFVRQLAQLAIAASSGITLERVHGAAHAADGLGVRRVLLQGKRFLVQRLQEFLRAFEEYLFELARLIFRKETHGAASMRWYAVPLFTWIILNLSVRPKRL